LSEPFLTEEDVNKIVEDGHGNLFAASLSEGVFRSKDGGKTWAPSSKGLHVRKVWEIAADPHRPGTLYAGTQYGHLFKSANYGETWDEVTSLYDAPNRLNWGIDWGFRTTGLTIHTIRFDHKDPGRIYLVAAGNGTYRSDDGGESWKSLKSGTNSACTIEPTKLISSAPSGAPHEERLSKHLSELHSCTHKIFVSPKDGKIYQQNHCGVYFSDSHGDHWEDVSVDSNNRFGFAIDVVESPSTNVFVIPVPESTNDCKEHNACIQGQLTVYSTSDGGKSWNSHTKGLPSVMHTTVLRDCLAHDNLKETGLYFGTTAGDLFFSEDLGNSWNKIANDLGRIQGVNVVMS
jgi:photosystem II stability/assembly factor-like uncharacterized protein